MAPLRPFVVVQPGERGSPKQPPHRTNFFILGRLNAPASKSILCCTPVLYGSTQQEARKVEMYRKSVAKDGGELPPVGNDTSVRALQWQAKKAGPLTAMEEISDDSTTAVPSLLYA